MPDENGTPETATPVAPSTPAPAAPVDIATLRAERDRLTATVADCTEAVAEMTAVLTAKGRPVDGNKIVDMLTVERSKAESALARATRAIETAERTAQIQPLLTKFGTIRVPDGMDVSALPTTIEIGNVVTALAKAKAIVHVLSQMSAVIGKANIPVEQWDTFPTLQLVQADGAVSVKVAERKTRAAGEGTGRGKASKILVKIIGASPESRFGSHVGETFGTDAAGTVGTYKSGAEAAEKIDPEGYLARKSGGHNPNWRDHFRAMGLVTDNDSVA